MGDARLVHRMLGGDERAFDDFFDAYYDRVFRFAARRTGDATTAEDVAQATLAQAMRRLETWRGEAALFTWLCTICRRELMAHWTRTQRQPPPLLAEDDVEVRAILEQIADTGDDPERALQRHEIANLVQATLDFLPGHYGDVLEWKYIEGLAMAEIADRLQSTPKAIESMLTRARQAFREAFADVAHATEDR
jgi:RNA polymerase sigma-70 factor (ECF subfamily)